MKAFVTGGTGFLGISLISQLLERGWEVIAMHRKGSNLRDLSKFNVHCVEADMASKDSLRAVIPNNIDAIFHVAGDTNMWRKNNDRQFQTNVESTQNLVDVALEKQVGRFIHTSSIAAYGFHDDVVDEQTPSRALQSEVNYLRTKFLGEQLVKKAVEEKHLDAVVLNPCAIIGPFDRTSWAQLFIMVNQDELPGVPPGEGSYCHVREVAAAHIAAYEKGQTGHNYILAGVDCAFVDVVSKIGKLLNKPVPSKPVPAFALKALGRVSYWLSLISNKEPNMTPEKALMVTKRVIASSAKASSELGYNDNVSIDEMLADSYKWLKSEQLV